MGGPTNKWATFKVARRPLGRHSGCMSTLMAAGSLKKEIGTASIRQEQTNIRSDIVKFSKKVMGKIGNFKIDYKFKDIGKEDNSSQATQEESNLGNR